MLRLACLLAVIAGCDTVFGLERDPVLHDEDGDGIDDAVDPCPQIANQTTTDKDGDHVSADCDPDDQVGGTMVAFFAFDDTFPPAGISLDGDGVTTQAGTIDFGTLTRFSSLTTTDITDATTVTIDVGFEILGAQIEDDPLNPVAYNELGIYAAHRAFTTDRKLRGDTCYFGRNVPGPDPLYLEMDEDDNDLLTMPIAGTLDGTTGRFRMHRTPLSFECTVARDGQSVLSAPKPVTTLNKIGGAIAISADHLKVRLRYLYIAYQPPPS